MRRLPTRTIAALVATASAALLAAPPAGAAQPARARHAVFVQTNDPSGNAIVAFHRLSDGTLRRDATYPTGGNGGFEPGAPADALASQGSLVYHRKPGVLLAVNAGSDSVTVFGVDGDVLTQRQVVASGGSFPTSIAVHGDLVYVLNAGADGSVAGFRLVDGLLQPLAGSTRSLGLANATPPAFNT